MFRVLLGNADFRQLLRSRLEHLLDGALATDILVGRLTDLAAAQWPEIPGHADRWEGFQTDWYEYNLDRTEQWISDRRPIFLAQADTFFTEWPAAPGPSDGDGLVINELLASNQAVNQDEAGGFADWVEIANIGNTTRNLTGFFLTDDLTEPTKWAFPAVMLRPGEHLVVWCDEDLAEGPLHADFKLSAGGESIGLFAPLAAGNTLVDSYTFGPQVTDVSEGRSPNDAEVWVAFETPTPGASNGTPISTPDQITTSPVARKVYPNPFNPSATVEFIVPHQGRVLLGIFDARGRHVVTLLDAQRQRGRHEVQWNGCDGRGRAVGSGVYFARLLTDSGSAFQTMTLVR